MAPIKLDVSSKQTVNLTDEKKTLALFPTGSFRMLLTSFEEISLKKILFWEFYRKTKKDRLTVAHEEKCLLFCLVCIGMSQN